MENIYLKERIRAQHPWISNQLLQKPAQRIPPGSIVEVVDPQGKWVGRGFYNGHARIGVRLLTTDPRETLDRSFLEARVRRAIELRHSVLGLDKHHTVYRLIHAEGDGLSGLIVDRFGDLLVIEIFAAGMYRWLPTLREVLKGHFPNARFYAFSERKTQKQESFDFREESIPPSITVSENGLQFQVAPGSHHKTGFFSDQRDNRKKLAELARAAEVLDLCCHSGGFSVYAKALGGAKSVLALDRDPEALTLAKANAALNQTEIDTVEADLVPWLEQAIAEKRSFDRVVLDPPRVTRDPSKIRQALKTYFIFNRLAMQLVRPGGTLLSCSCTGLIKEPEFIETIHAAAVSVRRIAQIFHVSSAGGDHPYLSGIPQSRYLKAVWIRLL